MFFAGNDTSRFLINDGNHSIADIMIGFNLDNISDGCFPTADFPLAQVCVGDAGLRPCFEIDITPNTRGDKSRSPVPTIVIASFAGEYAEFPV